MKTNVAFALAIVLVIQMAFATGSYSQDAGLFNGNGIKSQWGGTQESSKTNTRVIGQNARNVLGATRNSEPTTDEGKWKLPKFDFSKLKPNFQKPKFMQNYEFPKAVELSDSDNAKFLPSLPKMEWPSLNPSQSNFFQRMNDRTREMFGKTRDGFSNLGERSRNTWDSLTRGFGGENGSFGSLNTPPPPAQPQRRSARQTDGSTSKFLP